MEERVAFWQKQYEAKEAYIEQTNKEDREEYKDRIEYLQEQRDKFVESTLEEEKNK
jgi:hypothetical protein